jgi:hypothetical protein
MLKKFINLIPSLFIEKIIFVNLEIAFRDLEMIS